MRYVNHFVAVLSSLIGFTFFECIDRIVEMTFILGHIHTNSTGRSNANELYTSIHVIEDGIPSLESIRS